MAFFWARCTDMAADLQPLGRLPEREALEDGEPQGRGLGCRQLLHQLLQRQAIHGLAAWPARLLERPADRAGRARHRRWHRG